MGKVNIESVTKIYGKAPKTVDVIHGISINIADGEFIFMVPPVRL